MKVFEMPIDELIPADYNPRVDLQEDDEEFQKLKAVIETYGFVQPVVINIRTGTIVGGHQRTKVAKALGYEKVPVTKVDLDEADEKKLNLALNKVSGRWDEEALGMLLADLQGSGEELDITGFDDLEIEELTLAFADSGLDDLAGDFELSDTYEPSDDEESEYDDSEDDDDHSKGEENERGYIIQYNIVFDDEVQQETWHSFLKKLKDDLDNDAFPTHASRIHAFLKREIFK